MNSLILGLLCLLPSSNTPFENAINVRPVEPLVLTPSNPYCDKTPSDFPPPLPLCEYQVNVECFFNCLDEYNFAVAANISAACQAYNDAIETSKDCHTDAEIDWALCCLTCIPYDWDCYSKCAIKEINDKHACDTAFAASAAGIQTKFETDNATAYAAAEACMAGCCIDEDGN